MIKRGQDEENSQLIDMISLKGSTLIDAKKVINENLRMGSENTIKIGPAIATLRKYFLLSRNTIWFIKGDAG